MDKIILVGVVLSSIFCESCVGSVLVKATAQNLQVPFGGQICIRFEGNEELTCSEALIDGLDEVTFRFEKSEINFENERAPDLIIAGRDMYKRTTREERINLHSTVFGCTLNILNQNSLSTFLDPQSISIQYQLIGCSIPEDGYLVIEERKGDGILFQVNDGCRKTKSGCVGQFTFSSFEPATYSMELRLLSNDQKEIILDSKSNPHFNFNVVFSKFPRMGRRKKEQSRSGESVSLPNNIGVLEKCRIIFAGGFVLDGQKSIWATVFKHVSAHADIFEVEYITFAQENPKRGSFIDVLNQYGIPRTIQPLSLKNVRVEDLAEATETLIKSQHALLGTSRLRHAHQCPWDQKTDRNHCSKWLMELIILFIPPFAVDLVFHTIGHLEGFDTLVAVNSRLVSDSVLELSARLAGVQLTVFELANDEITPSLNPVVFIGPSLYAFNAFDRSRFKRSNTVLIHPGIEMEHFHFNFTWWENKPKKEFTFGLIGRVSAEKLPGLFLEFAVMLEKRHPEKKFRFLVIGSGPIETSLKRHVRMNGQNVEFLGFVPYQFLPTAIMELDFVVHLGYSETFCLANIESMAMGIPVISFASGGVEEYFKNGLNGYLISEPSIASIVQAAETAMALTTPASRHETSQSVQHLTSSAMANSYLQLFLEFSGFLR